MTRARAAHFRHRGFPWMGVRAFGSLNKHATHLEREGGLGEGASDFSKNGR